MRVCIVIRSKQEKILQIIIEYIESEQMAPTVREICDLS